MSIDKDKLLHVATQILAADMTAYKGDIQNGAAVHRAYHVSEASIKGMVDIATMLIKEVDSRSE